MKKLIKSTIKSFIQSKIAMILLAIVVFISSAAFTTLNNASISFQTSYERVMHEGNVHDFTIKEKWNIQGKNGITLKKEVGKSKTLPIIKSQPPTQSSFTKNQKSIYLPTLDSNKFELATNITNKTPGFKVDLTKAKLDYDKNSTLKIDGKISIFLYTGGKTNFPSNTQNINFNDLKWSNPITFDKNTKIGSKQNIKWNVLDDFLGSIKETKSTEITLKMSGADLFSYFETELANHFEPIVYNTFTIENSSSTGMYKSTNFDFSSLTSSKYPFLLPFADVQSALADTKTVDILKQVKSNMDKLLNTKISQIYKDQVMNLKLSDGNKIGSFLYKGAAVNSLFVGTKDKQFKIVSSRFQPQDVDRTIVFIGSKPIGRYSDFEMKKGLDNIWAKIKPKKGLFLTNGTTTDEKQKQFRWMRTGNLFGNPVASAAFSNFESLQAVVSSSYVNEHKLNVMSEDDREFFRSEYLKGRSKQELFEIFREEKKVIRVDSTDFIISGVGSSPDFAFPIINQKNPLPNAKTQAVIFTSHLGYKRIEDAFRNNEKENYLAFKFKSNTPESIQSEILSVIEKDAKKKMSWPKSISPLTKRNDINERVILAPQRISFLGKIQQSISTIAYLTTAMLMIFTFFIIIMTIKKQISNKRKILGTLLANGYSKNSIAISMIFIAFIIIVIPAGLGYISGYFFQWAFIGIFNNYWTLPIVFSKFSFITMSLVILIPMLTTMLFVYIFTRIALKGELMWILKESKSKTAGWITSKILGKLKGISTKTKITISLFTTNLSKMFVVCITSTIALVAGTIAFSMIGKFDYAQRMSSLPIKYSYKIDLETPTSIDNKYNISNINEYGLDGKQWTKTIDPNDMFMPTSKTSTLTMPYFHWIENPLQEKAASIELNYLKHKIQIRALLDMELGAFGVTTNPWSIAKASMPDNQLNQSDKADIEFNLNSYNNIKNYKRLDWFKALKQSDKQTVSTKLDAVLKKDWFKTIGISHGAKQGKTSINGNIDPVFKDYIFYALKTQIINRIHKQESFLPFMISYGNIAKDDNDETYSQLSFNYNGKGNNNSQVSSRIIGLNSTKNNMIKIDQVAWNRLLNFKMNDINTPNIEQDAMPIVINQYFQEAYKVNIGDTINLEISNHKNKNNVLEKHNTDAVVVGVDETYNGIKIYSLQKFVNNKLGFVPNQNIFNGVFTKQKEDPLIFKGVNLYAPSNFYIGASSINSTDTFWTKIEAEIKKASWTNKSVTDFQSYISAYSKTPYTLSMSNADWASMSAYAFKSSLDLTNKMIWMIEGVAILMAILFIAIIASMIMHDNIKFIATAKVLGYKKREINSMFFRSMLPSLFFSVILTMPILYSMLLGIKAIIMSFGSILVPLTFIWWALPLTFFLLISIFSIVYRSIMGRFGNEETLEAFKV